MQNATTLSVALLAAALAGPATANPDCYYSSPRIQDVVIDADHASIHIVGECLVEPYNPIPKVSLDADAELDLLRAEEHEVVVSAPELAEGDYVLLLRRGYHHERFAFTVPEAPASPSTP